MKHEKWLQVGLAATEEVAEIEGEDAGWNVEQLTVEGGRLDEVFRRITIEQTEEAVR